MQVINTTTLSTELKRPNLQWNKNASILSSNSSHTEGNFPATVLFFSSFLKNIFLLITRNIHSMPLLSCKHCANESLTDY